MSYAEKHITAFKSDLAKIRARASMYIGPTDSDGVFNLVREVLDNGLDEAKAKRNSFVGVWVLESGRRFVVVDYGVGIPVKIHPKAKISTLTHVLTSLQSSGKMTAEAYQNSVGVHGVGIKAVTALASKLTVWTFRKDAQGWHSTSFGSGKETAPVKKCAAPKLPDGTTPKNGTVFDFTVDPKIFASAKLDPVRLNKWAKISSFLNPNVAIKVTFEGKEPATYISKNGLQDYVDFRVAKDKVQILGKPIILSHSMVDIGIAFTDGIDVGVDFFTNTVANPDGGFHADTLFKVLYDTLKPYAGKRKFTAMSVKAGIIGILNVRLNSPKFSSQTKEKLVDEAAKAPLYEILKSEFATVWTKNKTFARNVCKRAADYAQAHVDFRNNAKVMRALKVPKGKALLPGKLMAAVHCKPEEREVFILEGESAGGCHIGDVEVRLGNGESKSFVQLAKDFEAGLDNYGIAFNKSKKCFVPFKLDHPRITKYATELIELTFDNGTVWKGTPDHLFLLKSGVYKKAEDLESTDELMESPQPPDRALF